MDFVKYDCRKQSDLELLYRKFAKSLIYKIKRSVDNHQLAQDILQSVFVSIWEKNPVFSSDEAAFKYLYRSCHNLLIDHLRRPHVRREVLGPEVFHYSFINSIANSVQSGEMKALSKDFIVKLFKQFDHEQGVIFVYKYSDQMTLDEIADITGLSKRTVQRRLEQIELIIAKWREKT